MLSLSKIILYSIAGGLIVFLCRAFPFIILSGKKNVIKTNKYILLFAEKYIPFAAMFILAATSIVSPIRENSALMIPVLSASVLTLAVHIIKRNPLVSVAAGTILYMVLIRL